MRSARRSPALLAERNLKSDGIIRKRRLAAALIYEPFTHGELGVLMPKGSEDLLSYVNTFLEKEIASGRIDEPAEAHPSTEDIRRRRTTERPEAKAFGPLSILNTGRFVGLERRIVAVFRAFAYSSRNYKQ